MIRFFFPNAAKGPIISIASPVLILQKFASMNQIEFVTEDSCTMPPTKIQGQVLGHILMNYGIKKFHLDTNKKLLLHIQLMKEPENKKYFEEKLQKDISIPTRIYS